jgi:hypothetical protein
VPCAHIAKKPNHKSGCVNRPADAFGSCHPRFEKDFDDSHPSVTPLSPVTSLLQSSIVNCS